MKVYQKSLPEDSLIAKALERTDYQDNYAIKVKRAQEISPTDLVKLFFKSFPSWFMALLYIRERVAKWIGLKTAEGMNVDRQFEAFEGKVGQSIALFHVLGSNTSEIMLGENDKHLDFRLSFFVEPMEDVTEISGATIVQFNAWQGRLYFFFVKPVHRLIMSVIMKRMARKIAG